MQNRGGQAQTPFYVDAIPLTQLPPGFVTTGAGGSTFIGDGGAATAAALGPAGIALDADGNLFIVDAINSRVRRVDARTGIVTTVAGNGQRDLFAGDGGPALLASLDAPQQVAFDRAGNLLIGEFWHGRIRKIDAQTGKISTIVDTSSLDDSGVRLSAGNGYFTPSAMTVNAAGDIFVADSFGNRVFKVDGNTYAITRIAGSSQKGFSGDGGRATAASINEPQGVVADRAGNIFISDHRNHRIRRVDAQTGMISTIAGTGEPGSCQDGAAAATCPVNNPSALTLDLDGNLVFSVWHRVRKLDFSTGTITAVAGCSDSDTGYSGEGGPAVRAAFLPGVTAQDAAGNPMARGHLKQGIQMNVRRARIKERVEAITPDEIHSYQLYLTTDKKLAPRTIAMTLAALRFLYNVTLRRRWVLEEVIPMPKVPNTLRWSSALRK